MEILQYVPGMGPNPVAKFSMDGLFSATNPTVFVQNQEEKDHISGLQLMYGKTIRVLTEQDWFTMMRMRRVQMHYDHSQLPLTLPRVFFATHQVTRDLLTTCM